MLLKRYLESGWLELFDRRTVYELSLYEEVRPDVFKASATEHDDAVTSLIWAIYFLITQHFDDRDLGIKSVDGKYRVSDDDETLPPVVMELDAGVDEWGFDWNLGCFN